MKALVLLASMLLLVACATTPSSTEPTRQILVNLVDPGHGAPPIRATSRYLASQRWARSLHVSDILARTARRHEITETASWPLDSIGLVCAVFDVPGTRVDAVLEALNQDPDIAFAQPMNRFTLLTGSSYDDPLFDVQYGVHREAVLALHAFGRGLDVTVGIIDTPVDLTHPDLAGQIAGQTNLTGAGMGEHGTAVAGVIAAAANNGEGVVGWAPEARMLIYGACEQTGDHATCSTLDLARALEAAIEDHVDVVNLSLAGPYDPLLAALINHAHGAGAAVIAAVDPTGAAPFPASMPQVIGVASADPSAPWFLRPEQLSTRAGGGYRVFYGSSMAAASVTGLYALLASTTLHTQPDAVISLLLDNRCSAIQTPELRDALGCTRADRTWQVEPVRF